MPRLCDQVLRNTVNEDVVKTAPRLYVETVKPFSCIRDDKVPKL